MKDLRVNTLALLVETRNTKGFESKTKSKPTTIDDPKEGFEGTKKPQISYFDLANRSKILDALPFHNKISHKKVMDSLKEFDSKNEFINIIIPGTKILKPDLDSLKNGCNISANIVDGYLKMIEMQSDNYSVKSIPSGITSKMLKCVIFETRYIWKDLNLRSDLLLLTFKNSTNEWTIICIDFKISAIKFASSTGESGADYEEKIKLFIDIASKQNKIVADVKDFLFYKIPSPTCIGIVDAGIFMLLIARFISNYLPIFPQSYKAI